MPRYLVQTRKAINTGGQAYRWSNRYFVDVATMQDALEKGVDIWGSYERQFHGQLAFCYEVYANLVGDAPFTPGQTLAVPAGISRGFKNQGGAAGAGQLLPNFNVVRVDFGVANSRPSRKFYRIPLQEIDIENASLTQETAVLVANGAGELAVGGNMVDVDGQLWTGSAVVRGITSRRVGRDAFAAVPPGPAFG